MLLLLLESVSYLFKYFKLEIKILQLPTLLPFLVFISARKSLFPPDLIFLLLEGFPLVHLLHLVHLVHYTKCTKSEEEGTPPNIAAMAVPTSIYQTSTGQYSMYAAIPYDVVLALSLSFP